MDLVPDAIARPLIKTIIVDDSLTMRRWLDSILARDGRLEVVGTAGTAQEARAVIKATQPDVLTLDIEMPGMNGLDFLSHIMRLRPMPVVMLSSNFERDASIRDKAIKIGAAACVKKPLFPTPDAVAYLCDRIVAAANGQGVPAAIVGDAALRDKIILVGASTGGVAAIEVLLSKIPKTAPPVVIAQHMPHPFLISFVERLNRVTDKAVDLARVGDVIRPGEVRIAPSQGLQTCVAWHGDAWHIQHVPRHDDHAFCPSVDVLFGSAVPWGGKVGAALLTGLGADGAKGMRTLLQNGAHTVVQSQNSCVVYGMPGAARKLDAAQHEVDISQIGPLMLQLFRTRKHSQATS